MDELAERDDDGGLEDDEEQRVQRHVLDGAVAPDGLHVAGRSEARRRIIPTPASCERGGGLGGRAPAGECAEGAAGLVPWDAPALLVVPWRCRVG